jgi:GNAT superfamily N-acetyltransferase
MRMSLVPLAAEHAEPAAFLVRDRLVALPRSVPELSEACGSPETLIPRIERLARRAPGAAAFADGRLVGFLAALPIHYGGRSSMLSPEWGNGVAGGLDSGAARQVREALYAEAAREWDKCGVETHILCLLAHDREAVEVYSWLGFGCIVCDAVRALDLVALSRATPCTRRATTADAENVCAFERQLQRHVESSPVFLLRDEAGNDAWWAEQLADAGRPVWLAEEQAAPVGYLAQGPASHDACDLIGDPGTSSITGAYVVPDARGRGAATALLARAIEWARNEGYARLAVDFETANVDGSRFWLRYFHPVVVSLARTVRVTRGAR